MNKDVSYNQPMILGIEYVRFLTDNFKEMHQFSGEKLGFKAKFSARNGPYEEFETGGSKLALFNRKEMVRTLGIKNIRITSLIKSI